MYALEETIQNAFSPTSLGANKAAAINELRSKYGELDIEEIRELLMSYVSQIYGVPLHRSSSPKNFGALCLDSNHAKYEVARKMLYRLAQKIKL